MNNENLPTESAKRIIIRKGLNDAFCDEEGKKDIYAYLEPLATFQRLVIAGTELETAVKVLYSYLTLGEDSTPMDDIEQEVLDAAKEIEEITRIESRAFVIKELMDVAAAKGGRMSWFDGKTKLDATRMLQDIIEGEKSVEDGKGLLFVLNGERANG